MAAALAWATPSSEAVAMLGGEPQDPGPEWAVRLDTAGGARCSAARVAYDWVITAAHCVVIHGAQTSAPAQISLSFRTAKTATVATPAEIRAHPNWRETERTRGYDVALLRLPAAVASAVGSVTLPLASDRELDQLSGRGVSLFAFGALEDRYPEVPYKTPDGAWRLLKARTDAADTGRSMLQFEQRQQNSVVRPGDSGGPWVGWHDGRWRLLSVVDGWRGARKQVGANLADPDLRRWLSEVVQGPRPASDDELRAFVSALTVGAHAACTDGQALQAEHLVGSVSGINPAWASATRTAAGASCGIGNGNFVLHRTSGVWQFVGYGGRAYIYCNSLRPQPPANVAAQLRMCAATPPGVRLGVKGLMGPYGRGWGTSHPREIYNGGVPSGLVRRITWRHWGHSTATGRGVTSIYRPNGGYYSQRAEIQLRASRVGLCPGGGARVYRRLEVRVPRRPGGTLGPWQLWSGLHDLCDPNSYAPR